MMTTCLAGICLAALAVAGVVGLLALFSRANDGFAHDEHEDGSA